LSPEPRPPEAGAGDPRALFLLGVPVHDVSEDEAVEWIARRARSGPPCHVVTSNLDFLRVALEDPEMQRIHLEADLVVADGMPLVWASRLFGPALRERVAGSDLVPRLAAVARARGLSVYAVGGGPGVAEKALRVLAERHPGLRIAGWESPEAAPLHRMDDDELLRRVREARPDLLFVALGSPKQEKWIRLHSGGWNVPVAIGVGGSLDFLAGVQSRAPRWLGRLGLEWVWRLLGQPRRLALRYARDFAFLAGLLARLLLLRLSPAGSRRSPVPSGRLPVLPMSRELPARLGGSPSAVVDLSRRLWLDSEELGALAAAARACRARGGRLHLAGRAPRVDRLLRLFRFERYAGLPDSAEDLDPVPGDGRASLRRAEHRLQVVLPAEFAGGAVARAREDFLSRWSEGGVREVVMDATRTEFVDSRGARFLLAAQRLVEREPGCSVWLLGVPEEELRRLRREGLDSVRVDRRRSFRPEPARRPG
jgi:N-acetylglucosaminyldiphosphoundecaprenol N-acetyl-beta-D-mannosaminyltransferase